MHNLANFFADFKQVTEQNSQTSEASFVLIPPPCLLPLCISLQHTPDILPAQNQSNFSLCLTISR